MKGNTDMVNIYLFRQGHQESAAGLPHSLSTRGVLCMIRVASYCRVSTDQEDQANSFASQQRYFREYIGRQPDWQLHEIYADEGVTGTSTRKRAAFNRMIHDAHLGRFSLILTKEVSRFSRNILDTISFTRELKALGVGVLFLNDGINTLDPDAELRLSIMGSIAQEESRKTSSRVKWGQTRRMEQGVVFGRSMLGYDVKDGCMTVNPAGAEIVRRIFHQYGVEKKGVSVIARELREQGIRTYSGGVKWSASQIVKMLKNEKYAGDLVQKKTITPDYLSHDKKYNHGEEQLVVIPNHHEPIVDRTLWELVQSELKQRNRRGEYGEGHSRRYVFSGKIQCGECGASFVSRTKKRADGTPSRRWGCYTAATEGRRRQDAQGNAIGCAVGRQLRDERAMEMLQTVLRSLPMDTEQMIHRVTALVIEAASVGEQAAADSTDRLESEREKLTAKKEAALDAFVSHSLTAEEMRLLNDRYDRELKVVQERLDAVRGRQSAAWDAVGQAERVRQQVTDIITCAEQSELFCKNLLDKMVVYGDGRVEISLNGLSRKWIFVQRKPAQKTKPPF